MASLTNSRNPDGSPLNIEVGWRPEGKLNVNQAVNEMDFERMMSLLLGQVGPRLGFDNPPEMIPEEDWRQLLAKVRDGDVFAPLFMKVDETENALKAVRAI